MTPFKLHISAKQSLLFESEVDMVVLQCYEGEMSITAEHSKLFSVLRPGPIKIFKDNKLIQQYFFTGGLALITQTSCTIIADCILDMEAIKTENIPQYLQDLHARNIASPFDSYYNDFELAEAKLKFQFETA